jgi:hypothetical protein
MESSIDFTITPASTSMATDSADIIDNVAVDCANGDDGAEGAEAEEAPQKRTSTRLASRKTRGTKKQLMIPDIVFKQPVIRTLLQKGAARDQIDMKKKGRPLMKSNDFIDCRDDSANNVIHFAAPSQTRPGVVYDVTLAYEFPTIAVYCNCGQSFGIEKRSNCYHVQSVMNILFENYFKQYVIDHRAAVKGHAPAPAVPDSRKRRRTSDMELDSDIRIERNSPEEMDEVPDAGADADAIPDVSVVDFLTHMMENFSIKTVTQVARH